MIEFITLVFIRFYYNIINVPKSRILKKLKKENLFLKKYVKVIV